MKLGNYYVNFSHTKTETACEVQNFNQQIISSAVAKCNPCDTFKKVQGRKVAMQRAIDQLPREERIQIWEDYKSRCKLI